MVYKSLAYLWTFGLLAIIASLPLGLRYVYVAGPYWLKGADSPLIVFRLIAGVILSLLAVLPHCEEGEIER